MKLLAACALITAGCAQVLGIEDPSGGSGHRAPDAHPSDALGGGDGTSTDAPAGCNVALSLGTKTNYPAAGNQWFEVGDLDHDGKPDLLLASTAAPGLTWWHNNGTGFTGQTPITLPSPCAQAETAHVIDIDGDGFNDVVAAACSQLFYIRQDAAHPGMFLAASVIPSPTAPTSAGGIAFGDFDGDGVVDAATNTGAMVSVSLQSKTTRGTFTAGPAFPIAQSPGPVVVPFVAGDFTNDGLDDLAYLDGGELEIAPQKPGGAGFGPPISPSPLTGFHNVATGLLDGDGHADLVALGGSSVALLQQPAPGQYTSIPLPSFAFGKFGLFIQDADGDGLPDIVADGEWLRNCPPAVGAGHTYGSPMPVGAAELTQFASLAAGAKPSLLYFDGVAGAVVVQLVE